MHDTPESRPLYLCCNCINKIRHLSFSVVLLYVYKCESMLYVSCMHCFFSIVPLLQESAQSITTLEGQSVSLECLPTSNNFPVQWMFNGNNLHESGKFTFSPINLNHSLSISDPGIDDSGDYNCYLDSFPMLNRTITLEVIEGTFVS